MCSRIGLRSVMAISALLTLSHIASAQPKVAVVNFQKAISESAEIKKAEVQMQATFKPKQDDIDRLQKEIAGIAQKLQSSNGKLSAQEESDLNNQGTKKQRELQRLQDDVNEAAQTYRTDVLSKSSQKMSDVVKKLAEEKGLDLVVDTSTTVYFKAALDITADAVAAYDKAYPAK